MSNYRQKNVFVSHFQSPVEENEAFVMCPQVFLAKLTPEEYRAQQEIYRRAYERAVAQVRGDSSGAYSFDI